MFAVIFFIPLILPTIGSLLFSATFMWPLATALIWLPLAIRQRWKTTLPAYLALQLVNSAFYISYAIQDAGFNNRFFYHLRLDSRHAGMEDYQASIILMLGTLALGLAAITYQKLKCAPPSYTMRRWVWALLVIGLCVYPPANDCGTYAYRTYFFGSTSAKLELAIAAVKRTPTVIPPAANNEKNLVWIYMESVEQSFYDESYYPDLMPELNAIRQQSLEFTHVTQLPEASWTIGGIVASQCGLPLMNPFSSSGNTNTIDESFMENAVCFHDVLKAGRYATHFIGGANTSFAGKRLFLQAHGYDKVEGRSQLEKHLKNKNYKHGWGLYDDTLYNEAFIRFMNRSEAKQPFALTVLTLDTHHPKGHPSKSCKPYPHNPDKNTMLDAIHCADQLAANFIKKIRESKYSDNTIIVVTSDHLAMFNRILNKIKAYPKDRRNLFFVNYPTGESKKNSHRGTQYDIAPTILEVLGHKIETPSFGLGTSLLNRDGFLHNEINDTAISGRSRVRQAVHELWDINFGNIKNGLNIEKNGSAISLGGRKIDLNSDGWMENAAALLSFDPKTFELLSFKIWPHHSGLKPGELARRVKTQPNRVFLVLAKLSHLRGASPAIDAINTNHEKKIAYFLGSAENSLSRSGIVPANATKRFSDQLLHRIFSHVKDTEGETIDPFWAKSPDTVPPQALQQKLANINFEAISCSSDACISTLSAENGNKKADRGLNLFAINKTGQSEFIARIDSCSKLGFDTQPTLNELVSQLSKKHTHLVVMVDDTLYCKNKPPKQLSNWLHGFPMPALSQLNYREPYIGVIELHAKKATAFRGYGEKKLRIRSGEGGLTSLDF